MERLSYDEYQGYLVQSRSIGADDHPRSECRSPKSN